MEIPEPPSRPPTQEPKRSLTSTLRNVVIGRPRDPTDPRVFHHVSLIAFLAWVGLGADGLSSSAYGPEEAFKALGNHIYLAVFLAAMTAITVFVISFAYSLLIEHFPGGGGGYLVATKLLGPRLGVVSGCALIVDYILTITVSVATGCDAVFSFLPARWAPVKLETEVFVLIFLIILNLRGVKESVTFLLPIFLVFVVMHLVLISYGVFAHFAGLPLILHGAVDEARRTSSSIGLLPTIFILLRAYSLGGGTYTGIEAVSNGVQILREPRIHNAKKTMLYMALSLAFTAGGILFCYLLIQARPVAGKTLNAVLAESLFQSWRLGSFPIGGYLVVVTLVSEGALLFVAAQTGFIDGPRILANMAVDSWVPHRFAQLSDRLVTKNGIFLMGAGAITVLLYSRGQSDLLILMYSINVFLTFTLTELGMSRYWIQTRHQPEHKRWRRNLAIHGTGLTMCLSILIVSIVEKFTEGGWLTVVVTSCFIALAYAIKRHYVRVREQLRRLDETLLNIPVRPHSAPEGSPRRDEPVAVLLVNGFSGLGVHTLLSVQKLFPKQFKSYLFVSVGVIDSASFKGAAEVDALKRHTIEDLKKYVAFARRLGFTADYRYETATEAVEKVVELCQQIRRDYPRSIFFLGSLVFEKDSLIYKI
ncbi:MAG TPA: APC family permease, partial [Thermoanaerobaculia bacterium]